MRLNRKGSAWVARRFPKVFANPKPNYKTNLLNLIECHLQKNKPLRVLEAGGLDRPLLLRSPAYEFVGLDIEEAPNCVQLYDRFLVQSIEEPLPLQVDMIISYNLLEHVPNNSLSIHQMFNGLTDGGAIFHYIPSGFHPYSMALRVIGTRMQKYLIPILRAGTEHITGYAAFFNLCTPSKMQKALGRVGFVEIDVQPYYRANDYFAFFTPMFIFVTLFENLCKRFDLSFFASGFVITARKPSKVV